MTTSTPPSTAVPFSRGSIVCLKKWSRDEDNARDNKTACELALSCGAIPHNVVASDAFNGFATRGQLSPECVTKLTEAGLLDHVEEDFQVHACGVASPWGIQRVGAEDSSVFTGGASTGKEGDDKEGVDVDVFVLDTGVEKGHPYLNVVDTISVIEDEPETDDLNGHGTLCAGIIGAWKQEADGFVGVAPGARIHGIKVLDKNGSGFNSDIISGIDEVAKFKRRNPRSRVVANLSLGGFVGTMRYTALDAEIVDIIEKRDVTCVVAAGNSSDDARFYSPAHVKEAITVGSIDRWNRFSTFSNYGQSVDVLAPGTDILSTTIGGKTSTASGTSFAAPFVAGAVALHLRKLSVSDREARPKATSGAILDLAKRTPRIQNLPDGTTELCLDVSGL